MPHLAHEIHAELSKPTLFDKVKNKATSEVDQLLDKGKMTYAAKKTYETLPSDLQATLPKPLQEKLGSAALPAFIGLLERMGKQAALLPPRLMGAAHALPGAMRELPGAAKAIATGATDVGMHKNEIAGLGVLAVPGLDTLQASARARFAGDKGHDAVEKRHLLGEGAHAALDVGGLGLLAAPAVAHLKHAFASSSYGGNAAQNPPGMRGRSQLPAFTAPEIAVKKTAGAAKRVGELLTGSKAKALSGAAADHAGKAVSAIKSRVTPAGAKDSDSIFKHLSQTSATARHERGAAKRLDTLAGKELGKVNATRAGAGAIAGASIGAAVTRDKEAGVGVGAGMSTSGYSGPLSMGAFKMVSGIPSFNSPELASKPAQKEAQQLVDCFHAALKDELQKIAGGMNTATDAMHAAGRLHTTQSVGAPKTTAPAGPSIAQIAKPRGYGTPVSGAKKNML